MASLWPSSAFCTRIRLMPQNRWKISEALENLDDLVKSVDSVGHSFGRIVQPRQYGFRWNGGEIGRDSNPSRMPRNSRSQDDRRDDDRDDD
ncbi:MAG: hypothetical protein ACLT2T_06125 [Bilophila wadsworthia]